MASDSTPPPPPSGSGLKYGIIGIVLLLGALIVFFIARDEDSPETGNAGGAVTLPDAGTQRSTALAEEALVLPDELPPDAGPLPDAGPPRIRYITRYVGGGGDWSCSGEIPSSVAAGTVSQHQRQFRNCYERQLKTNSTLEGRLQVNLKVGNDGRVTAVRTGGTMRDSNVLSCVRNVAQQIRFPNGPTGGSCAVINVPLNFTPQR